MEKIDAEGIIAQPESLEEPIHYSEAAKNFELDTCRVWVRPRKNPVAVTANAEVNTPIVELHSQATEVYSADEIRQSIKAAMATKAVEVKLVNQNKTTAMTELIHSSTKAVPASEIQEYKPESGDQEHEPHKTRKRRGILLKPRHSKRSRTRAETIDNFYVGKLSNICTETTKFITSDLDFYKSPLDIRGKDSISK